MNKIMMETGEAVREAVISYRRTAPRRAVLGDAPGGDAQFDVDAVAEQAAWDCLRSHGETAFAVYTEGEGLRTTGAEPEHLLVIDPIDGTRAASAGLEMCTVSIALARWGTGRPTLRDVVAAHVLQLADGAWLYADEGTPGLQSQGYPATVPAPSDNHEISRMFWSLELNGHPMELMSHAYHHLVDASANTGAVFVFNSASFSITRIVTGQLDAYVDIGNRILRDHPETEARFRAAGRGRILHLFGYDIAASVYLARRAGVTITDAYGRDLDDMPLVGVAPADQRSCIAASTPDLHRSLLDGIRWDRPSHVHDGGVR